MYKSLENFLNIVKNLIQEYQSQNNLKHPNKFTFNPPIIQNNLDSAHTKEKFKELTPNLKRVLVSRNASIRIQRYKLLPPIIPKQIHFRFLP